MHGTAVILSTLVHEFLYAMVCCGAQATPIMFSPHLERQLIAQYEGLRVKPVEYLQNPKPFGNALPSKKINLINELESKEESRNDYALSCQNRMIQANYSGSGLAYVSNGTVYLETGKCDNAVGVKGWKKVATLDLPTIQTCVREGTIYGKTTEYGRSIEQWSIKNRKLVKIVKYEDCVNEWGYRNALEIEAEYYPVKWIKRKHTGYNLNNMKYQYSLQRQY